MVEPEGAWLVTECWHEAPKTPSDNSGKCRNQPCSDLGLCRTHLAEIKRSAALWDPKEPVA